MSQELSTISHQDIKALEELAKNLPQPLIIEAEAGLDVELAVERLVSTSPSEIHHIVPEDGKNRIGIGQIRAKLASLTTFAHDRRIVIINPARSMTHEAQNSLLKTLEEPNRGLHFILVSGGPDALLPTVYSRCHHYRLQRTSSTQDQELVASFGLDQMTSQQILFLASGRPELMRQLATDSKLLANYQQVASDAKSIISSSSYGRLHLLLRHSTSRDDALRLIDILLSMLKFQLLQGSASPQLEHMIEKVASTESSLKKNAHVKIALLRLV